MQASEILQTGLLVMGQTPQNLRVALQWSIAKSYVNNNDDDVAFRKREYLVTSFAKDLETSSGSLHIPSPPGMRSAQILTESYKTTLIEQ